MRDAINQKVSPPRRFPQWADDILCEYRVKMMPKWQRESRYFMQQFQPGRSLITPHF
jgi:hypothetical protein